MKIAVVTGASSGIGKQFAKQIDNYGFDEIWGIALDEQGLLSLKDELKTKLISLPMDLTNEESFKTYVNLLEEKKPDVKLLINCSGFGKFGRYDEIPLEQSCNMIDLNCKAIVKMTELTLPYIKENGRIIQIASISGFSPIPYVNVYAATKAFLKNYSLALGEELIPRKISVTCVCPFWTKTQFFKRAKTTENDVITYYQVMYDAEKVVKYALKCAKKRKKLSLYGTTTKFLAFIARVVPTSMFFAIWRKQQNFKKKYWKK